MNAKIIRRMLAITLILSTSMSYAATTAFRMGQDSRLLNQYFNNPNSYPTTKSQTDYLHFDGDLTTAKRNLFTSNKVFYEVGTYNFGSEFDGTGIVNRLRIYESHGWTISGVFCYRENWLENRELGGPYPIDRRILSQQEITAVRNALETANPSLADVKLVQLLGGRTWRQARDSWMRMTDEMKEHIKQFDGIGVECHIGDHRPTVSKSQEALQTMAVITKWAQDNGKTAFVFMGGGPDSYENDHSAQQTYHYLWAEMMKQGVDYKSDHIIYFRQGARDGKHTPESSPNTLTHQVKWVIDSVKNQNPAIRAIANQTVAKNGATKVAVTLGAELITSFAEPVFTITSSNPTLLPNANLSLSGSGANRTLTLAPAANQTGATTVSISATIAPFSVSQSFTLSVPEPTVTTATVDGAINASATWGGALPVSGDRNVWQSGARTLRMATATETFHGDTLTIQSGGQFAPGVAAATLTLNNLVLNGGEIYMGNNIGLTMNLSGKRFVLNNGTLRSGSESGRVIKLANGSLTGSGTIQISGMNTNGSMVEFQSTIDTRGFTGTFAVSDNGVLNLPPFATANASFGLSISGTGNYANDAAVAVTSLSVGGTTYTSGTFGYADFPAYFLNNGGTVTVTANLPPTISTVTDQTIPEDGTTESLAFTIGDDLVAPGNLTVEAFSSNTTLVPDSNLFLGGSNATRTITAQPATNQSGVATITLRVSDGVFQTTETFVLTVNAVNDAPEIGAIENQLVDGSSTTVVPFTVSDIESAASSLTVNRASSNTALIPVANIVLGGSGANRTATITSAPGVTGTATITLTVSDGTLTGTRSFVYAVVPGTGPISAQQSGVITADTTWATGMAPLKGDTHIWQTGAHTVNMEGIQFAQFHGDTLRIQTGGQLLGNTFGPVLLVNNLILDGGQISMNNNLGMNIDLTGHTFTLNSGSIKSGGDNDLRDVTFAQGVLAGSGTINILGTSTNGSNVEFEKGITTKGFTGIFDVKENGILNLPPIAAGDASFGIVLSGTGKYWNNANIAVTSLTIAGNAFPNGTYTYANIGAAYQPYLGNNGGSITVLAPAIPPPAISPVADQTTIEGTPTPEIAFTVSGGADVNALQVSGFSQNPTLVPNQNFVFGGSGSNRTVEITPAPGQTGTASILLVVTDGTRSATNLFSLTVTPLPRTITAIADGNLSISATWGESTPLPTDINIWQSGSHTLEMKDGAAQTFNGATLVIQTNGSLIPGIAGATLSLNNLVLDGGTISLAHNLPFRLLLSGRTFTLHGGTLRSGSANNGRDLRFENGTLAGSGTVAITAATASGSDVEFTSTINTEGFSGLFDIKENGLLNLPPIATASFGLVISGSGKYWNDAAVNVTTLQIAGHTFMAGTYTYADIGAGYQPYLGDNGGTITVTQSPEPYVQWAEANNVTGTQSDDDDGDGLANVVEYALGGNPADPADRGHVPTIETGTNWLDYVHVKRRAPDSGVTYMVETSESLLAHDWTTNGVEFVGIEPLDAEFDAVTYRVSTETKTKQFLRLIIQYEPE